MAKMTKTQLIDAVAESSSMSKDDVKAVIEHMTTVGYKELNESGEFVIPGFAKLTVVNKPATEARSRAQRSSLPLVVVAGCGGAGRGVIPLQSGHTRLCSDHPMGGEDG